MTARILLALVAIRTYSIFRALVELQMAFGSYEVGSSSARRSRALWLQIELSLRPLLGAHGH